MLLECVIINRKEIYVDKIDETCTDNIVKTKDVLQDEFGMDYKLFYDFLKVQENLGITTVEDRLEYLEKSYQYIKLLRAYFFEYDRLIRPSARFGESVKTIMSTLKFGDQLAQCTSEEQVDAFFAKLGIRNYFVKTELLKYIMAIEDISIITYNTDEESIYNTMLSIFLEGTWRQL